MNDHEAKLIEIDTEPWRTDCSTPLFQRVRNMVARIEELENGMPRQTFTVRLSRTIRSGGNEIVIEAQASIRNPREHRPEATVAMLRAQCRDELDERQRTLEREKDEDRSLAENLADLERIGRRGSTFHDPKNPPPDPGTRPEPTPPPPTGRQL